MTVGCKPKCSLRGIYLPDRQMQRYCEACDIWFHVGCLVAATRAVSAADVAGFTSTDEVLNARLRTPIERGFLGGVVGNGEVWLNAREDIRQGRSVPGSVGLQPNAVLAAYFHCFSCVMYI